VALFRFALNPLTIIAGAIVVGLLWPESNQERIKP